MALFKRGGPGFAGKIGNRVEYLLNGQWIQRTIGRTDKPPTEKQLDNRQRMRLITGLLNPVKDLIQIGFPGDKSTRTLNSYNLACAYNRKHAITGQYPNLIVDFSKVLFTQGKMIPTLAAKAKKADSGIEFSWSIDPDYKNNRWDDQVIMIAYMTERDDAVFQISGSRRNEGSSLLKIPKYDEPVIYETYLSFISADHRMVSDSVYTGQLFL